MKKFIKIFTMLISVICLSVLFTCTKASAASFNPTDDIQVMLRSVKVNDKYLETHGSIYLKFDISGLQGTGSVTSATLELYAVNNPSNVSVYYVNDDSWSETSGVTWDNKPDYDLSSDLIASQYPNAPSGRQTITWDLSGYDFSNDILDGYLSLALDDGMYTGSYSKFMSKDYYHYCSNYQPPVLTITTCPAPEPSTMLLGLMGLGSVLGFRRKK